MRNFVSDGDVLQLAAPSGGVVSGTAYLIGGFFGVALTTAAVGVLFALRRRGVFDLPKAASITPAVGATIYWDNTAKNITTTSGGNTQVGKVVVSPGASDATVRVVLDL